MPRSSPTHHPLSSPGALSTGLEGAERLPALLAHANRLTDLLALLHRQLLDQTGGVSSLLFQQNPRNGLLHATSGYGLEALPGEPWAPEHDEEMLVAAAFDSASPVVVA